MIYHATEEAVLGIRIHHFMVQGMNTEPKRLLALHISPELLFDISQDGTLLCVPGQRSVRLSSRPMVPADAKLHHAYYDEQRRTFVVVVEHESFAPLCEGIHLSVAQITATEVP